MNGSVTIGVEDALLDLSDNDSLAALVRLRAEMLRTSAEGSVTLDRGGMLRVSGRLRMDYAMAVFEALKATGLLQIEPSPETRTWVLTPSSEALRLVRGGAGR